MAAATSPAARITNGSLVRKPGAFENYRYREDMFPTSHFRIAYDWLCRDHGPRKGVREYLKILQMAARDSQDAVQDALRLAITRGKAVSSESVRLAVERHQQAPAVTVARQMESLRDGSFLDRRENLLLFGKPGSGKSHCLCALGERLVHHGRSILFTTCSLLVQELLVAKRDLRLPKLIKKLLRFDGLIIDDLGYVQQSREEMEVLFTLLAERYERGSVMLTSNLPFSKWEQIFKDAMTTAAAIDRLVHHSVILELNVPSYRLENAKTPDKGQTGKKVKSARK